MTQNYRHINSSSFTPSPAHAALRRLAKGVGIFFGIIIAIILWVVVKPIMRALGWIISAVTLIAIIYWIMTL